ncbi:DUF2806 domain-containing protein [Vreelandella malpeensis]|uniref:DUF2806 domain-containing protein n=1 Tax=Vreelandella malpeensis TaxID=1172368 RepID=A0ABS8DNF0_9GAMM|nr:DUF2806 domain-containing protein [Halomonas malpeensis]MCB8887670.1 DUF2806 domain-containing protein [Halomonas malpeensis]
MGLEIKDLTGLSQPLTRLIEVTSAGLGKSTESFFRVKKAKAFAKQLDIVSEALKKHGKDLGGVKFSSEDIELIAKETGLDAHQAKEYTELMQRASSTEFSRSVQKQVNTESVLSHAAEELSDDTSIPEKDIDEDWLSLYFSIIENVSSDYMHRLWGKVLAGEMRSPDGFSLRTLEVLKTMTIQEAELFSKVVRKTVFNSDKVLIATNDAWGEVYDGLGFADYNLLEQIGLVQSLAINFLDLKKGDRIFFNNKGRVLTGIEFDEDVERFSISYTALTKIGNDIFSLIQNKETDYKHLLDFMRTFEINNKHKKIKAKLIEEFGVSDQANIIYIENW